jgi:hypothetical protein
MNGVWYLSLLTVGTAYLAGRGGFFFVVGGYVCYWILAPLLNARGLLPTPDTLQEAGMGMATFLRLNLFRPVGIGMIIGGALTGIVLALPLVLSAIRSMQRASKTRSAVSTDELPIKLLYFGIAGAAVVLAVTAKLSVPDIEVWRALTMAVLGTLWIWVAGVVLSECIGREFPRDLDAFVQARESVAHRFGLQAYAEVMNPFAAGERYLNRVWSAAADGYLDEALEYIGRAREQFHTAHDNLAAVHQSRVA